MDIRTWLHACQSISMSVAVRRLLQLSRLTYHLHLPLLVVRGTIPCVTNVAVFVSAGRYVTVCVANERRKSKLTPQAGASTSVLF
jgi:hypothetical protein